MRGPAAALDRARLLARGHWPELPRLDAGAGPRATVAPAGDPRDLDPAAAAELLAGLEQATCVLERAATTRRITRALTAAPERFPRLAAAFEATWPGLRPGDPEAALALGYRLRALKGQACGRRTLIEAGRHRDGIVWGVRTVPEETAESTSTPPHLRKEAA